MRVLLVEDDEQIAALIMTTLTKQNYVVEVARDGQEGLDLLDFMPYDLVLLDVMLPKLDGISFCRQVRERKKDVLVMLLTSRSTNADKILGLDAGADDYMVKPFDPQELLARIRALQRRSSVPVAAVLEWGEFRLDPTSRKATYGGKALTFRPKEFSLLELMLRDKNRVFSRSDFLNQLWSYEEPPTEGTIKAHIKGIRHALRRVQAEDLIETIYGQGYRLNPAFVSMKSAVAEPDPLTGKAIEPDAAAEASAAIAQIWGQVKGISFERLAVLEEAVQALQSGSFNHSHRQAAHQSSHKLAGALGMFGFLDSSAVAKRIEDCFEVETTDLPISDVVELVATLRSQIEARAGNTTPNTIENTQSYVTSNTINDVIGNATSHTIAQRAMSPAPAHVIKVATRVDASIALSGWLDSASMVCVEMPTAGVEPSLDAIQPDLVILQDDRSGPFICRSIRQSERWGWVPIVVLVTQNDLETRDRWFAVGADDCVEQSALKTELTMRIRHRVERTRRIQRSGIGGKRG